MMWDISELDCNSMLLSPKLHQRIPVRSPQTTICYRGWLIFAQTIKGQLWIRCRHPRDSYPQYGRPVTEAGISSAIEQVKFWIDIATKLEQRDSGQ